MRFKHMAAVAFLVVASSAQAQIINRSSSGLSSPTSTVTFSELSYPNGTPLTNQYAAYNITFSPNAHYDPQPGFFSTPSIGNFSFQTGIIIPVFSIQFTQAVSGAALNFITNAGTSLFEALLNGVVVSSFAGFTDTDTSFWYGFDNTTLDEIRFSPGGGNNATLFDNLQTSAVVTPEPASLVLLATGLVGIAGFARRRRNEG